MISTTVNAIIKQPLIIITIGIIMLVMAVINMFLPVLAMIVGIVRITGGDFYNSMLAVMRMLIEPSNIPMILLAVVVLALLISVAIALLLPGYLLIVNDGLSNNVKIKHLFIMGIRSYFAKFFLISIRSTLLSAIFGMFILVASVPAIVITRIALSSKPDLMMAAVFIDILTACVIFLSLSFYTIYTYMWYIASLTATKMPFKAGKAVADQNFWKIAMGLLVFDIIFVVGIFAIYMIGSQVSRYIAGWIFTTCFFTTLAVFLIKNFRDSSRIPIELK